MAQQPRRVARPKRYLSASIAIVSFLASTVLTGRASTWVPGGTGDWYVPYNWDNNQVPTASDTVRITNGGTARLAGNVAQAQALSLFLAPDAWNYGNLEVDSAGGLKVHSYLSVGERGAGSLQVRFGSSLINPDAAIGRVTGAYGTALIDGAGSTWTTQGTLEIGSYGAGNLTVRNGAHLATDYGYVGAGAPGTGNVQILGAGSEWTSQVRIIAGHYGSGSITVSSGAKVVTPETKIGGQSGSTGQINVVGTGSSWTNTGTDAFHVGYQGTGTLNVMSGATVTTANAVIGYSDHFNHGNGSATVDGTGSLWSAGDTLVLGGGSSELNIRNGGRVTATDVTVDGRQGARLTVAGENSRLEIGDHLKVGDLGGSGLMVIDGGVVTDVSADIGSQFISTGQVVVKGFGRWETSKALRVGVVSPGDLQILGGTVTAETAYIGGSEGGSVSVIYGNFSAPTMFVGQEGPGFLKIDYGGVAMAYDFSVAATGTVELLGTLAASRVFFGGTLRPSGTVPNNMILTGSGMTLDVGSLGTTLSGNLSGPGGLYKIGSGRAILSGTSNYSGETTLAGGRLLVSGKIFGARTTVMPGTILESGNNLTSQVSNLEVQANVFSPGRLFPGGSSGAGLSSIGRLNVDGTLIIGKPGDTIGAVLGLEIGGRTAGTEYDQIFTSDDVFLNAARLTLQLVNGFDSRVAVNDVFTLILNGGNNPLIGVFEDQTGSSTISGTTLITQGTTFLLNYGANVDGGPIGNDVTLTVMAITHMPEPGSTVLLVVGAGLLGGCSRRRANFRQ